MLERKHNPLTNLVKNVVAAAELSDFRLDRCPNSDEYKLSLSNGSFCFEGLYTVTRSGSISSNCRMIKLSDGKGWIEKFSSDGCNDQFVKDTGAMMFSRFKELAAFACTTGSEFITDLFNPNAGLDFSSVHVTDVKCTFEGGRRQVIGNLILTGVPSTRPPPTTISVTENGQLDSCTTQQYSIPDPNRVNGTINLQFILLEDQNDLSDIRPIERYIQLQIETIQGYKCSNFCSAAKILLSAFFAYPELASEPAISLAKLAEKIRDRFKSTIVSDEVVNGGTKIRDHLFWHFFDSPKIDRSKFDEGDLIIDVRPGKNPGLQIQIYRITELDSAVADGFNTVRVSSTAPDGTVERVDIMSNGFGKFFKRINNSELPFGGPGLLEIDYTYDLVPSCPRIIRWLEGGSDTSKLFAANEPETPNLHFARFSPGLFSWGFQVYDLLCPPYLRRLNDYKSPDFPRDRSNLKFDCSPAKCDLIREIKGIPNGIGAFRSPGYWKGTPGIAKMLREYNDLLGSCGDEEVVILGLTGRLRL